MAFRKMRRQNQELTKEQCEEILQRNTAGILAVHGDEGFPYAVPLSYVYHNGAVYFHCARAGHKIDAIQADPHVSFCVVDQDEVVPEKYTTYFRSVILFGQAQLLDDSAKIYDAMKALAAKYSPMLGPESFDKEMASSPHTGVVKITIEHMTGKEAIELVKKRKEL